MTVEIDASDLQEGFEELSRETAREAAGRWFSASQERLFAAGDEEDFETQSVAQAARPPQWDEERGGFAFEYPHPASIFFEVGTAPHEIEAKQAEMLAFEWEDAPPEVQEMFEDTWPTVFFKSVDHPGTPALRYVEHGMREAERWLEGRS